MWRCHTNMSKFVKWHTSTHAFLCHCKCALMCVLHVNLASKTFLLGGVCHVKKLVALSQRKDFSNLWLAKNQCRKFLTSPLPFVKEQVFEVKQQWNWTATLNIFVFSMSEQVSSVKKRKTGALTWQFIDASQLLLVNIWCIVLILLLDTVETAKL